MGCRIRQVLSWLLLLGAIVLSILLGMGFLNPPSAAAAIRQIEEALGQRVYQSRQSLKDQHGRPWQAIAFKRLRPDGQTSVALRLVGFPGVIAIDRTQPLKLTNSMGQVFTAADASEKVFADAAHPEPHIGQYDLQPLLAQLKPELPLEIDLPTVDGQFVKLSIPPSLIQEWQAVASAQ